MYPPSDDDMHIELGLAIDPDDLSVVVLMMVQESEFSEPVRILLGSPQQTGAAAQTLAKMAIHAAALDIELDGVLDYEAAMEVANQFGQRANAPFN